MFAQWKETSWWRLARGVKRALTPTGHTSLLEPNQCRAELEAVSPPVALEAGSKTEWRVKVTNRSGVPWASSGRCPVRLIARWQTFQHEPFGNGLSFALPRAIYPGEAVECTVDVPTPEFVGDFVLEFDLMQADAPSFSQQQEWTRPLQVAVPVVGRRDSDIDYHAVFRHANLNENHWWVVGAYATKEQYERSKQDRRDMLIQHGLTPDSRVLDVGCGTGQMADALQEYLSDQGAYFGTDIGKEAIQFCEAGFRRPNFRFRQGGMTTIPFSDAEGGVDLAIFFSVFTHTFTDESALLLAETRRLLKAEGRIIADIIVSPLVERGSGNRGEMIVNREHFLRLAAMLGFQAEVIGQWPWNPHAERLMLLLTR